MTETMHSLVKRQCYYNQYGRRVCDGWSNGARIGAGIAIAAGVLFFIFLILGLGARRRRRMASSTQPMYNAQQQPQQGTYYQQQGAYNQGGYQNQGGAYPNYQQQSYYPQQPNPVGPEQGGFKYPPYNREADDVEHGQSQPYSPPAGPPPGMDSSFGVSTPPAAPPPAYDGGKRV